MDARQNAYCHCLFPLKLETVETLPGCKSNRLDNRSGVKATGRVNDRQQFDEGFLLLVLRAKHLSGQLRLLPGLPGPSRPPCPPGPTRATRITRAIRATRAPRPTSQRPPTIGRRLFALGIAKQPSVLQQALSSWSSFRRRRHLWSSAKKGD